MSVLGVSRLVRDVTRTDGLDAHLREDPASVLDHYPLTPSERDAIVALDAAALVSLGVHPVVMFNLLVTLGVPRNQLYSHELTLRGPEG